MVHVDHLSGGRGQGVRRSPTHRGLRRFRAESVPDGPLVGRPAPPATRPGWTPRRPRAILAGPGREESTRNGRFVKAGRAGGGDRIAVARTPCRIDLDLARDTDQLDAASGCPAALPIPMFNSVYHDYHMTYGSRTSFKETRMDLFRWGLAMCLVSGVQLAVRDVFAEDEKRARFRPHFDYLETLVEARKAARDWLNVGERKRPLALNGTTVSVEYSDTQPPREGIPAVLNGCFALDGALCVVLANHTDGEQAVRFELDPEAYGLPVGVCRLLAVHPVPRATLATGTGPFRLELAMPGCSVRVLQVTPADTAESLPASRT